MTPLGRVVDLLLESSLGMRVRLGRATELHATANVVTALAAELTGLTRQTNLESDAVSDDEVGDV